MRVYSPPQRLNNLRQCRTRVECRELLSESVALLLGASLLTLIMSPVMQAWHRVVGNPLSSPFYVAHVSSLCKNAPSYSGRRWAIRKGHANVLEDINLNATHSKVDLITNIGSFTLYTLA